LGSELCDCALKMSDNFSGMFPDWENPDEVLIGVCSSSEMSGCLHLEGGNPGYLVIVQIPNANITVMCMLVIPFSAFFTVLDLPATTCNVVQL